MPRALDFAGCVRRQQGRRQHGCAHLTHPAAAQVKYKDREQIIKARDAADVPGAARYLLRSAPEMIAAAAQVKWQDFLNVVELRTLVPPPRNCQGRLNMTHSRQAIWQRSINRATSTWVSGRRWCTPRSCRAPTSLTYYNGSVCWLCALGDLCFQPALQGQAHGMA